MEVREYADLDAWGITEAVRAGTVSRSEVVDAASRALDEVEPHLAATVERFGEPLDAADDGVLAGVPFAIKDFVITAAGVATHAGSDFFGDVPAPADSALMRRFRRAGLRAVAVSKCPEIAFATTTEPRRFGPAHNPWDPSMSTGGSSGGAAALVASRALPVAHGNDGGGSIRVPAALTGLVGLKPSRGRVSLAPAFAEALSGMGVEFALVRTVRDCALVLDAVHGGEVGEKYDPPPVARPFVRELYEEPARLRIAVQTESWSGEPVDPEVAEAVRATAHLLAGAGHEVREGGPPLDGAAFDEANLRIWSTFTAAIVDMVAASRGTPAGREEFETASWAVLQHGRGVSGVDLLGAEMTQNRITREVAAWFADVDVLLTPATARTGWPLGELDQDATRHDTAESWYRKIFTPAPFSALFNMTGQPALSLPLHQSRDGLPIGVQLVARRGRDDTLIALAAQLERAQPWAGRRPQICAGGTGPT